MNAWAELRDARLEDERVLLRPLTASDRAQVHAIAFDEEIWRYFPSRVDSEAAFERFFARALEEQAAGTRVVFAVVDKALDRVAGSMSYGNLAEAELRIEIGWSWLGAAWRGSGLNTHAKRLLLRHAFERLGCERVEFKTDILNARARKGLEKIGATCEGVFRSYNFMPGGRRRDAIWYSIIKAEWPSVKARLWT